MNPHPLFLELKQICCEHNLDIVKAHITFDAYQELSEVKKLYELKYSFNHKLKMFYITGKNKETDEVPDSYIPVLSSDKMSPEEMSQIQAALSPITNRFNLLIRDRDSTSTCYLVSKGLIKPDSPETCKNKKDLEMQKYNLEKAVYNNRRVLFSKALRQYKIENSVKGQN